MADDKVDLPDNSYRRLFPWTELFRGFGVARDPKKLALAAAGIVAMWLGWWLLSLIFYGLRSEPHWETWPKGDNPEQTARAFQDFREDRAKWNLLYEAAGPREVRPDADDLAENPAQWEQLREAIPRAEKEGATQVELPGHKPFSLAPKPYGRLRLWPGSEQRGPNPFMLVTGQIERGPGEAYVWNWLLTNEGPVVIEPLVKFLLPIFYILHPHAGFWNHLYFLLTIVWTAFVWAIFGGAITRMAAVQLARRDKISIPEALRFTWSRWVSYFTAPLLPILFAGIILVLLMIFGLPQLIKWVGDLWSGLLWPVVILAGLAMAGILGVLVAWPLMVATISTEGSDNFDALSRAYSYLYQYPWHYLWYSLVAIVYGAALIFFVCFVGSFLVWLGKWGVAQTPFIQSVDRSPEYLFAYAPTSFGWRALLMDGAQAKTPGSQPVVVNGSINPTGYDQYLADFRGLNHVGAFLVSLWTHVLFLLVLGFGYSYFWTAGTIIYLLMRRKVDDTEFDEVYLEEEEPEETYSMTTPSAPAPPPAPTPAATPGLQMVEAPTLRGSPSPPPPPPAAPAPAPTHESAGTVATHEPPPAPTTLPSEAAPPTSDGNRAPEGGTT